MGTQNGKLGLVIPTMEDKPDAQVLFDNFRKIEEKLPELYPTKEYVDGLIGELSEVTNSIKEVVGV